MDCVFGFRMSLVENYEGIVQDRGSNVVQLFVFQ